MINSFYNDSPISSGGHSIGVGGDIYIYMYIYI